MIEKGKRFFKGYVRILVRSSHYDRFLNLCAGRGLYIWDLLPKNCGYEMNISISDFKKLRPIVRKCNTHVKIIKRYGLPFFLYGNRNRKFLAAGVLCGTLMMFLLSMFVWNIELTGNHAETSEAIFQYLKKDNIYFGTRKSTIDCKALGEELRRAFKNFTWVSVRMKGTSLLIEVKENETTKYPLNEGEVVSDLVAGSGGVITDIITRSGVPMVKKGDRVEKGDLLVAGEIPVYNDAGEIIRYQYCAADADIRIRTVYTYQDQFPLKYEERSYTGEEKKTFYIKVADRIFGWKNKKNTYSESDLLYREWQLGFSRYFKLPVYVGEQTIREYDTETKKYDEKAAKIKMQQKIIKNLEKIQEKGVQIFKNNVTIETDGLYCTANGCLVLIHNTGKRVERTIIDR